MIKTLLFTKILDELYDSVKKKVIEKKCSLRIDKSDLEEALKFHTTSNLNWSKDISLSEHIEDKPTLKTYIPLEYFVIPRSLEIIHSNKNKKIKLLDVLQNEKNIIFIGQPGAGKTTTLQYISQSYYFHSNFLPSYNYLIVLRLRDLNRKPKASIINELLSCLGIFINYKGKSSLTKLSEINKFILLEAFEKLSPLILLDGFDEIFDTNLRESLLYDLDWLSLASDSHKFILTSRTGDLPRGVKNCKFFEISSLEENQILQFAKNWLNEQEDINDFLLKIKKTPYYDTSIRPLTMSHLCALYERYKTIPSKPKAIYKKIVNMLLEKWDIDRGVNRKSNFPNFDQDKKLELVSFLAYYLTIKYKTSVFSYEIMEEGYLNASKQINLPNSKTKLVLAELELHSGLIIQNTHDTYEFAHKSLQEYLCADYLVKMPPNKLQSLTLLYIPNEIAIAISISPTYFQYIVLNLLSKINITKNFVSIFLNRLLIEEPEFSISLELGIAACQLLSLSYLGFSIAHGGEIFNLFSRLFSEQNIVQSLKLLHSYYQIEKRPNISNTPKVIQLAQYKVISISDNLYIPRTLILNESIFSVNGFPSSIS